MMTLDFISISRRVKIKEAFIIALLIISLIGCNETSIPNYVVLNEFYDVIKLSEGNYKIILYDSSEKRIKELELEKEPAVHELPNNIIRFTISVGSPANYTFFYDVNNNLVSPTFFNVLLYDNNKVVYAEEGKIVISDPFDKGVYFEEITRDFSPTAVPSSAIQEVKFLESGNLHIEYLKGKEYIVQKEEINLDFE